jgi:hemoglobin
MNDAPPSATQTPFEMMGGNAEGEARVRALVERFYDAMDRDEPELAKLHPLEHGKVSRASRDRFALFLIGWLGGPQEYMRLHGHPRLRMRHASVPVSTAMRDAWLRCMREALSDPSIGQSLRVFLDQRFAELGDFLRNQAE